MRAEDLELRQLTGQLLVVGFHGTTVPEGLSEAFERGERGGAIVFKRNLPSLEAALEQNRALVAAAPSELPPLLSVDQEGGRVARLPPPFLKLPPMRRLGALDDAAFIERVGSVLGAELAALGYNLDFAPVLDVDSNPENPVIGDRAFGSDPERVARLSCAFGKGLEGAGVMACEKHFPGHGDTHTDSHLELPVVSHDARRLADVELVPFRAAAAMGISTLMTAHVVYEALDPGTPATLSERIATELLRHELGFRGLLFSDDLEMKALADRMSVEESAVRAIRAGCDALLVCSSFELAERAHRALLREAEQDDAFRQCCVQAVDRGLELRRRFAPRPAPDASGVGGARVRGLEAEIATLIGPG